MDSSRHEATSADASRPATTSTNVPLTVPLASELVGNCHGSAAGSQSGPLGGNDSSVMNDSSVIKPSQAIISPTEADTAAPPAAKRDRSGPSPHDQIITDHFIEGHSFELLSDSSGSGNIDMGSSTHLASGMPPTMPIGDRGRTLGAGTQHPAADEFVTPRSSASPGLRSVSQRQGESQRRSKARSLSGTAGSTRNLKVKRAVAAPQHRGRIGGAIQPHILAPSCRAEGAQDV